MCTWHIGQLFVQNTCSNTGFSRNIWFVILFTIELVNTYTLEMSGNSWYWTAWSELLLLLWLARDTSKNPRYIWKLVSTLGWHLGGGVGKGDMWRGQNKKKIWEETWFSTCSILAKSLIRLETVAELPLPLVKSAFNLWYLLASSHLLALEYA